MKAVGLFLISAGVVLAQAPNPVQRGVSQDPGNGSTPVFSVTVTSKTVRAVNYHHRQGTTKVDFRGTALLPAARGEATVQSNTGATRISLKFDHLSNPAQFGTEYLTYVLWAITPEGRPERLGEVTLKNANDKTAELYATTDLQSFGMIVTAEPYFSVSQPSDVVVMENFIRADTTGTMEQVDAKYELLKRGQYTLNLPTDRLAPITSDLKVPLQLREAREAIAIAKAQGADKWAPDTMQRAGVDLLNAEGYFKGGHNDKQLETVAREATQMAEDARRISIEKEREQAEQAARDAAAQREADAKRRTEEARAQAADEAARRARAEKDSAAADAARRQAEQLTADARRAQQDAEAARQAALAEQAKLAQQTAAAEAARKAAEQDTVALRDKLRQQLNSILETRDTARGLIVNMSDVLFDFNQATLKPGAKEKLARVSGILLAYPTLHLSAEGHTDAIGSDEYNLKLSQRRADAVRDYLTSNGLNAANLQAVGVGKANPVATNDTAAGRSQNRRVELVVSGDVIGQPINTAAPGVTTNQGPAGAQSPAGALPQAQPYGQQPANRVPDQGNKVAPQP